MKFDVILLDGKRISCTFSPYDRIENVLESICTQHDLDPRGYVLSYNSYFLYNDLQLRTFGFSDEDTLELLEDFRPTCHESVQVILRIKDSNISSSFHPDVTLWKVVQCLVASAFLQIPNSTPVLVRKNIEYIGYNELSAVTLRSLHVRKGSLFFRFSVVEDYVLSRRTAKVLGSTESLQFELTKSYDTERRIVTYHSNSLTNLQKKVIRYGTGIERRGSSVFEEMTYLGERNALAYRAERSSTATGVTDDFYDLVQEDVELMYNQLLAKRKELETMIIKPQDKIVVESHLAMIRIVFPDTTVLQGVFNADETIKDVEEFVELYRRVPKQFKLRPPKVILESEKTLEHYHLVPTGKMFYTIVGSKHPDRTAYLKEDVLRNLTSQETACYASALCHMKFPAFEDESPESSSDSGSLSSHTLIPLDSRSSGFEVVD